MPNQRSPDGRLVYLHCSSIFSGADAQVRKAKKVSQLLEKHKASIKILTKEFTLPAIAVVARDLLEKRIFESLPRAKIRYPELFQPSETQEAERAASEAEVVRIEAEAAQDIVLTSDDERGDDCPNFQESHPCAEPEGPVPDKAEALKNIPTSAVELWQVLSEDSMREIICSCTQLIFPNSKPSISQAHQIPRLHPVYLPFKSQHRVLVLIQCLLEECCLEFGNTWVPDLMEARKWHEAESIELTQWTKSFIKHAKDLPPSALKPIAGKSIAAVLFGTSALRHSAVHRLPTSAAGIQNMLHAAMIFTEALNDSKRAEKVADIKMQLEASIEEIVQHQNLLERKLQDQVEDIARRRSELDRLERSAIEEMLVMDKEQRTMVGSAFESFLIRSQQVSNSCAWKYIPSLDGATADSEVEENMESSGIGWFHMLFPFCMSHPFLNLFLIIPPEREQRLVERIDKAQTCGQSLLGEVKSQKDGMSETDTSPPWHDNTGGGLEKETEVSELSLSNLYLKGKNKKKKKKLAASSWGIPVVEEAPVLRVEAPASGEASSPLDNVTHDLGWKWRPRHMGWNFGATRDIPAEPDTTGEAIHGAEPCMAAPEEASSVEEPYGIVPEVESVPEDAFPARIAVSSVGPMGMESAAPSATLEASQAELNIEDFNAAEEQTLNRHDDTSHDLDDPCESTSGPHVALMHSALAESAEFIVPPPRAALSAVGDESDFRSPPPSAPSSIVTRILEAAAPKAPTEDSHTITLKILTDSRTLRSIVFVRACTRTAILKEARAYCAKRSQDDQSLATLLAREYDLALMSLKMYGYDMDLSTYKVENLSSLVCAIEKTGIPRFTLRISEI